MRAAVFDAFGKDLEIRQVADPVAGPGSVVLEVRANGICRSDWHAWMGHDPNIRLPHVPGHEMAGVVVEVGHGVSHFDLGDRVTVPFCCGCGACRYCRQGQLQICERDFQPGFTHWGAFAQFVEIHYADHNLVRLPESLDFVTAATLGCRFSTAFHALVHQGRAALGETVVVHGCGGLGLSAIMIAKALGAVVIAIDVQAEKLEFASSLGAAHVIDASSTEDVAAAVRRITDGGADVSIDALGDRETVWNSIRCLRRQGRHIQAGLLLGKNLDPSIPMGPVIGGELQILGSHGMSAREYPRMLELICQGVLSPEKLISRRISLSRSSRLMAEMESFKALGVVVIDDFVN